MNGKINKLIIKSVLEPKIVEYLVMMNGDLEMESAISQHKKC